MGGLWANWIGMKNEWVGKVISLLFVGPPNVGSGERL